MKLTPDRVEELRRRKAAGESASALAAEFGVSERYVYQLAARADGPQPTPADNDARVLETITAVLERARKNPDGVSAADVASLTKTWELLRARVEGMGPKFDESRLSPLALQVAQVLSEQGFGERPSVTRAELARLVRRWLRELEA